MTLTAGTTLQYGKYLIQSVLEQSDLGATYQAFHLPLDQPVVLQSLLGGEGDRFENNTLRQQFLAEVRRVFKLKLPNRPRILDCFVEFEIPYVVLDIKGDRTNLVTDGRSLPRLQDWLIPAAHPELEAADLKGQPAEPEPADSKSAVASDDVADTKPSQDAASNAAELTPLSLDHPINQGAPVENPLFAPKAIVSGPARVSLNGSGSSTSKLSMNGASKPVKEQVKDTVTVSSTSAPGEKAGNVARRRWLAVSLLLTSVIAGLGGAGLGFAARRHSQNLQRGETPALLDPFVNNEQSFPPIEGWVGDDPVRTYSPEALSEEVLPAAPSAAEQDFEQRSPLTDLSPQQSSRQFEGDRFEPAPLPEAEAEWLPPDTTPVEPSFGNPPQAPEAPPSYAAPEAPPAVEVPQAQPEYPSKPKLGSEPSLPEPPRQTQSLEQTAPPLQEPSALP